MLPLPFIPSKPRVHHTRRGVAAAPAALTLVSAVYNEGPDLVLTFDRQIDIASMDVNQVIVDDGEIFGFRYQGVGAPELTSPTTVRVLLNGISEDPDPGVHFSVGAANGIVAVDDGAAWTGCVDLVLPYP